MGYLQRQTVQRLHSEKEQYRGSRPACLRLFCAVAVLATAAAWMLAPVAAYSQPAATRQRHPAKKKPSPAVPAPPPAPPAPPPPLPLLQQPPQPATVTLSGNRLTVQANNSSLSQILHDIGSSTGMKIDGLDHDRRIFGNIGPAAARDVITQLLDGAGYNVMMVGGNPDGAPRQLALTPRGAAVSSAAATPSAVHHPQDSDQDGSDILPDESPQDETPAQTDTPPQRPPGPPTPGSGNSMQQQQQQQQLMQQQMQRMQDLSRQNQQNQPPNQNSDDNQQH